MVDFYSNIMEALLSEIMRDIIGSARKAPVAHWFRSFKQTVLRVNYNSPEHRISCGFIDPLTR